MEKSLCQICGVATVHHMDWEDKFVFICLNCFGTIIPREFEELIREDKVTFVSMEEVRYHCLINNRKQ